MPQLFLALYVVCLSLGAGAIVLVFLYAGRYGSHAIRLFGYVLCASTLLLATETMRTYEAALQVALGPADKPLLAFLSAVSSASATFLIPTFAYALIKVPVGKGLRAVHLCLAVAAGCLGALQEYLVPAVFWRASFAFLMGIHGYAFLVIWGRQGRIADPRARSLVHTLLILVAVYFPLGLAQMVLHGMPGVPSFLRDYPLEPLLYFMAVLIILLAYAGRYVLMPMPPSDYALPQSSAERYGISNREREIIPLILKGLNHKQIGQSLSISSSTVKNHVYNIYQKTGVINRVQLMNLLYPRNPPNPHMT